MGLRLTKAQVAMEFVMLAMLAFMIMVVFTVVARERMLDLREEEEYTQLKDVVLTVQSEIITANSVEPGYKRIFYIPSTIDGINYTIGITGEYLIGESKNHEYIVQVPSVSGNVQKGDNTITREDGAVQLNG